MYLTKILNTVTAHGYMEENDVKSICLGTRLEFKMEKDEKIFTLKSDRLLSFYFKSRQDEKSLFQNLTRYTFFKPKSDALCFLNSKSDT